MDIKTEPGKNNPPRPCYVYLSPHLGSAKYEYILRENGFLVNPPPGQGAAAKTEHPILYFIATRDFTPKLTINQETLPKGFIGETLYILILNEEEPLLNEYENNKSIFSIIREPTSKQSLLLNINNACSYLTAARRAHYFETGFETQANKLKQLNTIGIALSTEKDTNKLLALILKKSREITHSDAGSIYLVTEFSDGGKYLQYKFTENDTLDVSEAKDVTMQINKESISGYVALTGETVNIEDVYSMEHLQVPYKFYSTFDKSVGYRTCSMLVVPMKDHNGLIIGVIQLINKKRTKTPIPDMAKIHDVVIPFVQEDTDILLSLASQAAVALENTNLIENIQNLFEGFVNASVTAIESRDPTTSGHSFRVAEMTVQLAKVVDRAGGIFAPITFSKIQIQELRYASLLHDFGKVGVRENVLTKAKKLYPYELDLIKARFELIKKDMLLKGAHEKLKVALDLSTSPEERALHFKQFDENLEIAIEQITERLKLIISANEPTILEEGNFQKIIEIAKEEYLDFAGKKFRFLYEDEVSGLSIRRGSLSHAERVEIESHVTHTYKFLSKIPWTPEIRNVPAIAYAHHEWLNGNGYPNNLKAEEIPIQSKMMAVADIFDALTASDRPYKKAVSVPKALDILHSEVQNQHIEKELVKIFIDSKVFQIINL